MDEEKSKGEILKPGEQNYVLVRFLFIRLLSLIYFIAFLSFLLEAKGLYGGDGILPIADFIESRFPDPATISLLQYPSLFLYWHDDSSLIFLPALGMTASVLAFSGLFTGPCLIVMWLLYLSIVNAGQDFMSFQWDILLLETGFLSIFFASYKPLDLNFAYLKNNRWPWLVESGKPSRVMIWLYRWLLFRLLFASGLVKLGDPTWDSFTALVYHYQTQPLPTMLGWLAYQLPYWCQQFSTAATLFIELLIPPMIFMGRKLRTIACSIQIFLQLLIILTGNFCFFNWLTIALCLFLLDDDQILYCISRINSQLKEKVGEFIKVSASPHKLKMLVLGPLSCLILFLSCYNFIPLSPLGDSFPPAAYTLLQATYPFHMVSGYGLFARMTTERREIVVEASYDGKEWRPYNFKYKPGPLDRAPGLVAPLQPRLDWQMWFAALGDVRQNPWFVSFLERLLTGSKSVNGLLAEAPYSDRSEPPRFVRASFYQYQMTDIPELLSTGHWWKRTYIGLYVPPISLKK